jgi:L-rhamnose mutarotase
MPRVMFTISYSIKPEFRDQYLALVREMKQHLTTGGKHNYSVFEAKAKKNVFTEVFLTNSIEEYDALEDNLDDKVQEMISTLEGYVDDGGMKYNTVIEAA